MQIFCTVCVLKYVINSLRFAKAKVKDGTLNTSKITDFLWATAGETMLLLRKASMFDIVTYIYTTRFSVVITKRDLIGKARSSSCKVHYVQGANVPKIKFSCVVCIRELITIIIKVYDICISRRNHDLGRCVITIMNILI